MDTLAGLVTFAAPQDLPEGASPRNYDVDYIVGSVFTRPGLQSVYTFASVLNITALIIGSGKVGTFTYTGTAPIINEGFLLGGFLGINSFLNGQTIYVLGVNALTQTFTAFVNGPSGAYVAIGLATS